jgi:hypothetical protein
MYSSFGNVSGWIRALIRKVTFDEKSNGITPSRLSTEQLSTVFRELNSFIYFLL